MEEITFHSVYGDRKLNGINWTRIKFIALVNYRGLEKDKSAISLLHIQLP